MDRTVRSSARTVRVYKSPSTSHVRGRSSSLKLSSLSISPSMDANLPYRYLHSLLSTEYLCTLQQSSRPHRHQDIYSTIRPHRSSNCPTSPSPSFKTLARLTLSVGVCGRTSEGRRGQPLQSLRSLRKQTFGEFIGFCGLQMGVRGGDFDVVGAPGRLSTIPFDF